MNINGVKGILTGGKRGVSPSEYAGFCLFLCNPVFNPIGTLKGREDIRRPHCLDHTFAPPQPGAHAQTCGLLLLRCLHL